MIQLKLMKIDKYNFYLDRNLAHNPEISISFIQTFNVEKARHKFIKATVHLKRTVMYCGLNVDCHIIVWFLIITHFTQRSCCSEIYFNLQIRQQPSISKSTLEVFSLIYTTNLILHNFFKNGILQSARWQIKCMLQTTVDVVEMGGLSLSVLTRKRCKSFQC